MDLGLLNVEVSKSHSGAPNSVGLLRKSDGPNAETSTLLDTQLPKKTNSTSLAEFEPTIPVSERAQKGIKCCTFTFINSENA